MEKTKRFAWTWTVKEEFLDEYIKMHQNPWPEIMDAHSKAGIKNYSIFQNGNQFFYVFECKEPEAAFSYMDQDPDCQRWNAITSKMVDKGFDFGESIPDAMKEVFYLA